MPAYGSGPTTSTDARPLDCLSLSKRELLLLLGRGHTAKSIATLQGLSDFAVNERFRSARRKTGMGSSREIARLLVAQENRDDFIGLAEPVVPAPSVDRPDAPRRASPFRRWRLPMAAAFLLATALFAQQTAVPSPTLSDRAVQVAAAASVADIAPPSLTALHDEVAAGPPDPESSSTETALSQSYERIPAVSRAIGPVSVTCTVSLCEVFGVSRPGAPNADIETLGEAIPVQYLNETGNRLQLHLVAQSLSSKKDGSAADNPTATVLVAYWRRDIEP